MSDSPATNQSIDRALNLLEVLATKGIALSISEISRMLSVNRMTAQTLINSLEAQNYVEKDPETGKYRLGYQMFEFGAMYRHQYPFLYAAEKHIVSVFQRTNVKINVLVLKPNGVAIIILSKDMSLVPHMVHGRIIPPYVSGGGKMLLSSLPSDELDAMLDQMEFRQFTPHSIVDRNVLKAELETIRQRGYSIDKEELVLHRACVAAPICDISGKTIAAVSFSDSSELIESRLEELIQEITLLAKAISSELGYSYLNFQ